MIAVVLPSYQLIGNVQRVTFTALTTALEADSPVEAQRILNTLLVRRAEAELAERQRIAQRRSGARGKAARADEIEGEREVEKAMKR